MALMPGQKTLAVIRQEARRSADRTIIGAPLIGIPDPYANNFITTEELTGYVNASFFELYDLMVTAYGNYYFTSDYCFTAVQGQDKYPLPNDCYKLLGIDWVQTPGNNTANVTLKPFNLGERNNFNIPVMAPPYGGWVPRYTQFGSQLWLKPLPNGGATYKIIYVPRAQPLVDTAAVQLNGVKSGDTLTINGVTFTAIDYGQPPSGTQFVVGGTGTSNLGDAGTAVSLTASVNASSLGGYAGILKAGIDPTISSTQVQIVLTAPAQMTWSVSNTDMILFPSMQSGASGGAITWTNVMTDYSDWSEYLVVDAAIRMVQKEGSDVSVLMAQKDALLKRIGSACDNRDEGAARTSTDVYGGNYGGGWGGGSGGAGGWS